MTPPVPRQCKTAEGKTPAERQCKQSEHMTQATPLQLRQQDEQHKNLIMSSLKTDFTNSFVINAAILATEHQTTKNRQTPSKRHESTPQKNSNPKKKQDSCQNANGINFSIDSILENSETKNAQPKSTQVNLKNSNLRPLQTNTFNNETNSNSADTILSTTSVLNSADKLAFQRPWKAPTVVAKAKAEATAKKKYVQIDRIVNNSTTEIEAPAAGAHTSGAGAAVPNCDAAAPAVQTVHHTVTSCPEAFTLYTTTDSCEGAEEKLSESSYIVTPAAGGAAATQSTAIASKTGAAAARANSTAATSTEPPATARQGVHTGDTSCTAARELDTNTCMRHCETLSTSDKKLTESAYTITAAAGIAAAAEAVVIACDNVNAAVKGARSRR